MSEPELSAGFKVDRWVKNVECTAEDYNFLAFSIFFCCLPTHTYIECAGRLYLDIPARAAHCIIKWHVRTNKKKKIKTGYKLCFVSNKKKAAWEGLEKLLNKRTVWNVIWSLTYKYFPIFMQMLRGEKIFSLKAFAKRVHWKGIGKMMSNLVICISLNFLSGYFSSEEKSNYSHGRWSITFPRILKEMF